MCSAVPAASCQHLVIISTVKITFNLIIHLCVVSCSFLYRTCQSHFAKITNLTKRFGEKTKTKAKKKEPERLESIPVIISPCYDKPRVWFSGSQTVVVEGLLISCISARGGEGFNATDVCVYDLFSLVRFRSLTASNVLLGLVLELQAEYFWRDEEDFSGSPRPVCVCVCRVAWCRVDAWQRTTRYSISRDFRKWWRH